MEPNAPAALTQRFTTRPFRPFSQETIFLIEVEMEKPLDQIPALAGGYLFASPQADAPPAPSPRRQALREAW